MSGLDIPPRQRFSVRLLTPPQSMADSKRCCRRTSRSGSSSRSRSRSPQAPRQRSEYITEFKASKGRSNAHGSAGSAPHDLSAPKRSVTRLSTCLTACHSSSTPQHTPTPHRIAACSGATPEWPLQFCKLLGVHAQGKEKGCCSWKCMGLPCCLAALHMSIEAGFSAVETVHEA